jgi:hypothetical protein
MPMPTDYAAKAAETAHLLAECVHRSHQLDAIVAELETQLRQRAEESTRLVRDCEHAVTLTNFVREEGTHLRAKLLLAEAEIARLTNELSSWKA